MDNNYYDILGVNANATIEDIRKQYKKLAKKLHPDTGIDNDMFMRMLNEAYETLKDERKREEYDKSLKEAGSNYNNQYQDFNNNYYGDSYKTNNSSQTNNYRNTYNYNNNYTGNKENDTKDYCYNLSKLSGFKRFVFLFFFYLKRLLSYLSLGIFILFGAVASIAMKLSAAIFGILAITVVGSLFMGTTIDWFGITGLSIINGVFYYACDRHEIIYEKLFDLLEWLLTKLYNALV